MFAPKLKSILLHKIIKKYLHSASTPQCERVCLSGGHFADPVMSWLREWHLCIYRGHQLGGHILLPLLARRLLGLVVWYGSLLATFGGFSYSSLNFLTTAHPPTHPSPPLHPTHLPSHSAGLKLVRIRKNRKP